jgi:hypothetical protein
MHEDTVRSETLSAVAGDGVAVVEVTIVCRVELDVAVVVEAGGDAAVPCITLRNTVD